MSQQPPQSQIVVRRRGIAMMLVMVAILVTGAMAVAYFGSRDNSIAISANISSASKARVLAESGIDLAVAILETDSDWRTNHLEGVILQDHQICDGFVTVTIIDSDTDLPPTESTLEVVIKVASTFEGRTQYTEAIATIIPNDEEFDVDYSEFAIFARNRITLRGNSSVQNWSASPVSSEQSILIGTLSTSPMSVRNGSMSNTSSLELRTPMNASSMVSTFMMNSREFTDTLPFLSPPPPPIEPQELSMFNDHDDDMLTRWAHRFATSYSSFSTMHSDPTIISEGNYELEKFELTANQQVEIHGDVTITVHDDASMHNATIVLIEDATLTMHFGGEVDISSSYIGNENQSIQSWMDPSRVRLFSNEEEKWNISGFTTLKSEIYAPSSEVELRGHSVVCGRIASETVSLRGSSRVLYDPSLNNGGFADSDSMLYNEDGSLQQEIQRLTQLDPVLLDSIERAISDAAIDSDEYQFQNHSGFNWRADPTERPHTVVYMLIVYGVDARIWETNAREASRTDRNTHAWVDDE